MKAFLKNYRQSPRKVRLVADVIRGKEVNRVLSELDFLPKRASLPIKKLVLSALANAEHNFGKEREDLLVKAIRVEDGVTLRRFRPRARGSASRIRKRTSNVYIELASKTQ